jgi:hypothetical protein
MTDTREPDVEYDLASLTGDTATFTRDDSEFELSFELQHWVDLGRPVTIVVEGQS